MAEIETEELARLAQQSRLRPPTASDSRAIEDTRNLLRSFSMLQDVNTDGVEPSPYPLPIPAQLRPDAPEDALTQDQVLANAPHQRSGCFLVPRVVEG